MQNCIIVPVVLCGCETWSLTLKKEHRLRVFQNGCSGKYLELRGRKWQKAGEDCIVRVFVTFTLQEILLG